MRWALLAALLGAMTTTAADPIVPVDFSKGEEPKDPYVVKVEYREFRDGKHVATYANVHAYYKDITDPKLGEYRHWRLRTRHVAGMQSKGSQVVEAGGKVWEVFAYGSVTSGERWANTRPLAKKP